MKKGGIFKIFIMNRKIKVSSFILLVGMFALCTAANAQFGFGTPGLNGGGNLPSAGGNNSPVVPFDGGMSLAFAAAGVGYVKKKLFGKKAKN